MPLIACQDIVGQPLVARESSSSGGDASGVETPYEQQNAAGGSTARSGETVTPGKPNGGAGNGPLQAAAEGNSAQASSTRYSGGVPSTTYCEPIGNWSVSDYEQESNFLSTLNFARSTGTQCGNAASGSPLAPLAMTEQLRCAARLHSLEMATVGTYNGVGPAARIRLAGSSVSIAAEVVAQSATESTEEVVRRLLSNDNAECQSLLSTAYTQVGVGFTNGYWTIDLAYP